MKNRILEIEKQIAFCKQELEELHFVETSEEWYLTRRYEIEYKIACLEDTLEFEKKTAPLRWMLYCFIVCAFILLFWAYLKSK